MTTGTETRRGPWCCRSRPPTAGAPMRTPGSALAWPRKSFILSTPRAMQNVDTDKLAEEIQKQSAWVPLVKEEMGRVVVGQHELVDRLLTGLLTNGHVLLEGVPGLAKTLTVNSLAGALSAQFQRIQFTPDLLPADLIGTLIYNPGRNEFT